MVALDAKKGGIKKTGKLLSNDEDDNGVEEKTTAQEKAKPIHTWFKDNAKIPENRAKLFGLITKKELQTIEKENNESKSPLPKNKSLDDVLAGKVYEFIKSSTSTLKTLKILRQEIDSTKDSSDGHEVDIDDE